MIEKKVREVSGTLYKIPSHEGDSSLGLLVTFWASELIRMYEKPLQAETHMHNNSQGPDEEHEVHLKGFHKRLLVSGREQVKEPPWWPRTVILLTQEAKAEGSQVQSLSGLQCKFKASLENLVGVCLKNENYGQGDISLSALV